MDFFTFFVLVCLTALVVYAQRIEKRRQRDAAKFRETAATLTARIHTLEQQSKSPLPMRPVTVHVPAAPEPKPVPPPPKAAESFDVSHPPQLSPKTKEVAAIPPAPGVPEKEPLHPPLAAAASASATPPKAPIAGPVHSPAAASSTMDRRAGLSGLSGNAPSAPAASHAAPAPIAGMIKHPAIPPAPQAVPFHGNLFERVQKKNQNTSWEELIGTNWLPMVGVTILVLAIVLFTANRWEHMTAGAQVALIYVLGVGLLSGGIFFERKEKYQVLGRVLIGGGWSVLFFITFAMSYVVKRPMVSHAVDLVLLLIVTSAMVWHTLKYNSQTVTGFAFFLGFLSVTVSHNTSLSLVAGALLVLGLTVIVLRRNWFELEVFGILASYVNHYFWISEIFTRSGRQPFSDYPASVALMVGYWVIFRASYLLRKVGDREQESVSTVAALLNPAMFLGVMRYQSFHPEWAFWALLVMGAVEFVLGQLPVSHRRKAPFQILSSLGVTLMVMAVPFKYAGSHSLELLWMVGAEAFLLAGVLTRERLFRHFGGIISLLVAAYLFGWSPNGIIYQAAKILTGQPHQDASLSLVLATVAILYYINSHVIARIWKTLFEQEVEKQALATLSFVASVFAVGAMYAAVSNNVVAVTLAMLVTLLAGTGNRFAIPQLIYQAHWIAAVAVLDVSVHAVHLDAPWHSIPQRLISFGFVAGFLYWSSSFVRVDRSQNQEIPVLLYRWAGTGLIALAIWMQIWAAPVRRDWLIAVLWISFALVLSGVAQLLKRNEFRWQAFTLVLMSFCCALVVNFDFTELFHGLSYRLISVTLVAGGIYLLARWAPVAEVVPTYTWAGTILLGYLAYRETQARYELWTPVLWAALAALLGLAARVWKDRALLWQTHLLAALATTWTIGIVFLGNFGYNGTRAQVISVGITSLLLYALTWITNVRGVVESDLIWQAYSWAASLLVTWLVWYQLPPIDVSPVWGLFALLIFVVGYKSSSAYLRSQAYVALTCSFAHLFYANFNTQLPLGTFDPHILPVVVLVSIYFGVYWLLHQKNAGVNPGEKQLRVEYLLACMGTATVAALARFELAPETVVVGYAAVVLALLITAWWSNLPVFLHQALAMLGVTAFRLCLHNFLNFQRSFVSSLPGAVWAIMLLVAGIPFAFLLRSKKAGSADTQSWLLFVIQRPEQPLFFVSSFLLAVLLALKMHSSWITLSWCGEGILMIVAGFFARERSFRLAGLGLFLLSAGKVCAVDLWAVSDLGVRFLAMGGVGAVMVAAGYLFSRNREVLRKYL
jgi:hypothetical protein